MKRSLFWLLDHYPETGESVAALHEAALEEAALADSLGFHSLWLAEHHFRSLSTVPNPAVVLAAMAQRTGSIRLGPATSVLPLHNPIRVAEDYALVDVLSQGRLNMGVGCGSQSLEFQPFGINFDQRREDFAAGLAEFRRRWKSATEGDLGPSSINVAPVQQPAPPIYVATMNENSAYDIGQAGYSLLTLVPPSSEDLTAVTARLTAHRRGIGEAGLEDAPAESVVMIFTHLSETPAAAKATAVPALGRLIHNMSGTELADPGALYEQLRKNDTGLLGSPDEVHRQLARLADHGVNHVACVTRFGGISREAARQSLRLLGAIDSPPIPA